jgi:hypothetical protein
MRLLRPLTQTRNDRLNQYLWLGHCEESARADDEAIWQINA